VPRRHADSNGQDLAYVSQSVIKWAIERSGLERELIAQKLGIHTQALQGWERENGPHPPFSKAQELAKILRIPFGYLYLKKPPSGSLPLPDFRGFNRSYKPTNDLLDLLNDILFKQDWYRDYAKESKLPTLKFVRSFELSDSIFDVAANIRLTLGITQRLRQSVSSWTEYLSTLARQTEDSGILVMRSGVVANLSKRKLRIDELQGFAIADPIAPVVFVNSVDFTASQTFTIAHELAHIWIGQTALANADELGDSHGEVEAFCNRVAAEVLVPSEEFLNAWKYDSVPAGPKRIQHMARQFWVSTLVVVRRAHELGRITDDQFEQFKEAERAKRRKLPSSGGDYYRNLVARMGARLTTAVLGEVNNGNLPLRDGAQLLGMKVPTLVKFAETWK